MKPTRIVAWCATCGPDVPPVDVDHWLMGWRFRCSKSSFDDFHVAAVTDARTLWWLKCQALLVRVCTSRLHPRYFLCRRRAELYVPILAAILGLAYWLTPSIAWAGVALAIVVLVDTLVFNTMVAFVTQRPRLAMRTMFFAVATFLQIAAAFGVFYRALPESSFDAAIRTNFDAFYFSVITLATVGYGDIHPVRDAGWAQGMVLTEIGCGLYFLTGLFTIMASWAGASPALPTLDELRSQ